MATMGQSSSMRLLFRKTAVSSGASLALVAACILSIALVVMSGALIGFMQYQARLLNSSADITSGDVVLQAELDSRMRKEQASLDEVRDAKENSKIDFVSKQQEVQFRIERICGSLNLTPAGLQVCNAFMQTIPFNEADQQSLASANKSDKLSDSETGPSSNFDEPSTVKSVHDALHLDGLQDNILGLHRKELRPIAKLNVDLYNIYFPKYFKASSALYSTCTRVLRLATNMNGYRSFSVDDCYLSTQLGDDLSSFSAASLSNSAVSGNLAAGNQTGSDGTSKPQGNPVTNSDMASANDITSAASGLPTNVPPGSEIGPQAPSRDDPVSAEIVVGRGGDTSELFDSSTSSSRSPGAAEFASRQRNFELVSQYLFYDALSFGVLKHILISPPDFLAFTLTGMCGVLGGLLKIILTASQTGKPPTWRGFWIIVLLGLICALIFYSLFRGGYLAISNEDPKTSATGLNPFVIALLALASGLLSDRAISAFKMRSNQYFGEFNNSFVDRWGFGLKAAMENFPLSKNDIAERCKVAPEKLQNWIDETEAVPSEAQDILEVILHRPKREIFTQDPPQV
ncbi:hypothetical protein [Rhizobium tubonense]|uniref:Uncharacterized protein n=1 Tax=Rhizobium tubonense TaxID=484088 RepID=A0A2W4C380_9HYPH|nr:hypothetical protein [Rhizobium tubonense]PZM07957.1 hypothetical protein CPY51_29800 [Rhizobium tubonense]